MSVSDARRILVIDDDQEMRNALDALLGSAGWQVTLLPRARQAVETWSDLEADVILSDLQMPGMSGTELLEALPPDAPPLVLISAYGDVPTAVTAMQNGAFSFVEKPFEPRHLLQLLDRAAEHFALHRKTRRLKERLTQLSGLDRVFLGETPPAQAVRDQVLELADLDVPVLLLGETGTGKDVIAHALHDLGARAEGPFEAINCAVLTQSNFEEAMMGQAGGASGHLTRARSGTLLLDEVAATPPAVQAALLRILEERQFRPIGAETPGPLEARIIAATNADLEALVAQGAFRADLFYRLNVVSLTMPTLRQRADDLTLLFTHFVRRLATLYEQDVPELTAEDVAGLLAHDWPGNVRELRHVAERYVLAARRGSPSVAAAITPGEDAAGMPQNLRASVATLERELIGRAIRASQGRMDDAAQSLGIGRRTLNEKIVKLGLDKDALL